MIEAYVLIKVEAGSIQDAMESIRKIPGVESVKAITGPADLIANVQASDPQELAGMVMHELHKIEGVKETDTRFIIGRAA